MQLPAWYLQIARPVREQRVMLESETSLSFLEKSRELLRKSHRWSAQVQAEVRRRIAAENQHGTDIGVEPPVQQSHQMEAGYR